MKKILIVEDSVQILAQLSYIAREINSSNKIYAFSSIIIALISCIISTVTFVMQFLM